MDGEISVLKEVIQIMAIYRMFPGVVARLADPARYNYNSCAHTHVKRKGRERERRRDAPLKFLYFFRKTQVETTAVAHGAKSAVR